MIPDTGATVDGVIERALDAYAALAELGEEVEDDWTYVDALSSAWRDRLETIAAERHGQLLDASVVAAIDTVAAEAGRISDPYRAIDWLSTYPLVVLIALDEQP